MPTDVSELYHIAISVSDLERSVQWYQDVLGMEVYRRAENTSQELALTVGVSQVHTKTALLRLPGKPFYIEMAQYLKPKGRTITSGANQEVGAYHLGFQVSDIEATYQRMLARGVRFKSSPVLFPSGAKATYFLDPDGIILELIQPSRASPKKA